MCIQVSGDTIYNIINNDDAIKKTERILWKYPLIIEIIEDKVNEINDIKKYGVPTKSKSIMQYQSGGNISQSLETPDELIEEVIENIENDITWLRAVIYKIDSALDFIKSDELYDIVDRYYFKKESLYKLAVDYKVEISTISKWKRKLLGKMALYLFPQNTVEITDSLEES